MQGPIMNLGWKTLTGAAVTVLSGVLPLLHVSPSLVNLAFTAGLGFMGVGLRHAIAKEAAILRPFVDAALDAAQKADASATVAAQATQTAAGHASLAASVANLAAQALRQVADPRNAGRQLSAVVAGAVAPDAVDAANLAQFSGAPGAPGAAVKPSDVPPGAPSG